MAKEDVYIPEVTVCGSVLTSLCDYVRSRLQKKGLESFFTRLSPDDRRTIITARESEWYPFSLERHLREAIVREFNPEDPRRAVFEADLFISQYDISGLLYAILKSMPMDVLLKKAQLLWGRLYRPGRIRAVANNNNHVVVELMGFPSDPLFCPRIEAWSVVAARILGSKNVKVSETACLHRGHPLCRWEVTWNTDQGML